VNPTFDAHTHERKKKKKGRYRNPKRSLLPSPKSGGKKTKKTTHRGRSLQGKGKKKGGGKRGSPKYFLRTASFTKTRSPGLPEQKRRKPTRDPGEGERGGRKDTDLSRPFNFVERIRERTATRICGQKERKREVVSRTCPLQQKKGRGE